VRADPVSPGAPLLINAREAAKLLAISERTLWTLMRNQEVPVVRIGRAIRYPLADLIAWVKHRKGEQRR